MILLRAYASLWDFVNSVFGTQIPSTVPMMYGFFMAIAFGVGIWIARNELARKTALGIFSKNTRTIIVGKGIDWIEVLIYSIIGYIVGLKFIGILIDNTGFMSNPQDYFLSLQGSKLGGIIGTILWAGSLIYSQNKEKLDSPKEVQISHNLEDRIGDILFIAMVGGILGSKILDAIDNPASMADFLSNPISSLTSGLSVLGGLWLVSIMLIYYAWKNKFNILAFTDTLAPPFFLSYAIGRLSCQFSGDGCWGLATSNLIQPSWLPNFLWGNTYSHNVNNDGIPIPNCTEPYCMVLEEPHLPTPLYETIIVSILFLVLWKLRKRFTYQFGFISGLFFIFNGLERFFIEFFRLNTKYPFLGFNYSQAQYMSCLMIAIGAGLVFYSYQNKKTELGNA